MKTKTKTGLAVLMLLAISCTKETLHNPETTSTQTQNNAAAQLAVHFIGERFGGGVVFYVNSAGTHGLIADSVDLPQAVWYNGTYIATGATGTAIGSGKANTKKIVAVFGKPINANYNYAALQCSRSKRNGFSDWYLPSKDELNELYKQRDVIGNFTFDGYWSSSEPDSFLAWYLGFNNGVLNYFNKNNVFDVRAIRSF